MVSLAFSVVKYRSTITLLLDLDSIGALVARESSEGLTRFRSSRIFLGVELKVSAHHPPLFVSRCRRSLLLRSGWTSAVVSVKALAGFASSGGVVRSLSVARVECSGVTAHGVVYALASLSGSSSPVFALLSRFWFVVLSRHKCIFLV